MLTKFNDWVTKALMVAAAILAFMLCFLVVADVSGRVLFNSNKKETVAGLSRGFLEPVGIECSLHVVSVLFNALSESSRARVLCCF